MEKEKLFFKLFKAIREIQSEQTSFNLNKWDKELYGVIVKMNNSTLDIVLDIFSRLNYYSYYNISFIIEKYHLIEEIFYENGNFIDEKLVLLSKPYDKPFYCSHIITEYCYTNDIPVEEFEKYIIFRNDSDMLEEIIKNNNLYTCYIMDYLSLLFQIYKDSPKFYSTLKLGPLLGPLNKMQITIYEKTKSEYAELDREKYLKFISSNRNNASIINKLINYINNCEFVEHETVEFICAMDINALNELIEKYGKEIVFEQILVNEEAKILSKLSPKLLINILNSNLNLEQKNKMIHTYISLDSRQIEAMETLILNIN